MVTTSLRFATVSFRHPCACPSLSVSVRDFVASSNAERVLFTFHVSECENLLRKMLDRDRSKRITLDKYPHWHSTTCSILKSLVCAESLSIVGSKLALLRVFQVSAWVDWTTSTATPLAWALVRTVLMDLVTCYSNVFGCRRPRCRASRQCMQLWRNNRWWQRYCEQWRRRQYCAVPSTCVRLYSAPHYAHARPHSTRPCACVHPAVSRHGRAEPRRSIADPLARSLSYWLTDWLTIRLVDWFSPSWLRLP